jgi:hypothetical protein
MFNKEEMCKAHHEVMLEHLLVHQDRAASAIKCHPWKILKLPHRYPLRFPLSHVVVHLRRGDSNTYEVLYVVADTFEIALFEATAQVKPPVD